MPVIPGVFFGFSTCVAVTCTHNSIIYEKKGESGREEREGGGERAWGYLWSLYSVDIFTCIYGVMF